MCAPLIVLLALAACGQGTDAATPAAQQKAISMDGKPHILEQRGKFTITPTTLFCGDRSYIAPELVKIFGNSEHYGGLERLPEALEKIGQPTYINGSTRWGALDQKHCPDNGHNIIIHQSLSLNAAGTPYRIEMTARQGAALARVGVERAGFSTKFQTGMPVPSHDPEYWNPAGDALQISKVIITAIFK
jgi:hypothetical protein